MKSSYLFLDIDGCLNSEQEVNYHRRLRMKWWFHRRWVWRWTFKIVNVFQWLTNKKICYFYYRFDMLTWWFHWFDNHHDFCPIACSNIQYLLEESPQTQIVVSSVWRSSGVKWMKRILKRNGIDPTRVISVTGDSGHYQWGDHATRGMQIQHWLDQHQGYRSFVIIDDDSDMGRLSKKLVKIDNYHGVQHRDIIRALYLLNGTCGWCKGRGRSRRTKYVIPDKKKTAYHPVCEYCGGRGYRRTKKSS